MKFTASEIAGRVGGKLTGDGSLEINGVNSLEKAGPCDISFVMNEQSVRELKTCKAGALFVSEQLSEKLTEKHEIGALIFVPDAQLSFIEMMSTFRPVPPRASCGISASAHVSPSARIGEQTNVFPGAFIDEDVVIGANCDIYPGVVVGRGCQIGDGVTIHPNVALYPEASLGNGVIIHAGAVIGADGFGYRFESGRYVKIPQLGTVRIEDDVEIGANTTIDCGMIGPTVIGRGSKIDNLVMIAHNCEIGKHNAFASQVGLAGSVTTESYVRCAGQVGVADHVHLGEKCTLGAGAGVHKSLPGGKTYYGAPARPEAEQLQIFMAETRLPQMRVKFRELSRTVSEISKKIDEIAPPSAQSEAA